MDDKVICRVMFYSYTMLEDKCECIDKDIYCMAVHSAFKNTMATYQAIERLTNEKIAYINVKVIIDKGIRNLKRNYELVQHHFNGVTIDELAQRLGTTVRAMTARVKRQREKLYEEILKEHKAEELIDILYQSYWLMHRYKRELKRTTQISPPVGVSDRGRE